MMNIKKVKPMFTTVVTTMDKYENPQLKDGLIDNSKDEGSVKEFQKVVAIGDAVRGIEVGDIICFNPMRYAVKMHKNGSLKDGIIEDNPVMSYNFPTIVLDGVEHLVLQNNDIEFIIEDYDMLDDDYSDLITS